MMSAANKERVQALEGVRQGAQIGAPHDLLGDGRGDDDLAKAVYRVEATQGRPVRLEKRVTYHTSRGVPVRELADRCERTLDRAASHGAPHYVAEQRAWFDAFWAAADVTAVPSTAEASISPASSAMDLSALASAIVSASGFSHQTCRPAARQARLTV